MSDRMQTMRWFPVAVLATMLGASPAPAITFTPLGDLVGGDTNSTAYAISNDGTTVVGTSSALLGFEAFRWTQLTGMVTLGDLAGGSNDSAAYAASGTGSVSAGVGNAANAND